jgi:5-formyltetrahydrofolate cyclo-ligase
MQTSVTKQELRSAYQIKRKYLNCYQREAFDDAIFETFFEGLGTFESFFIYHSFGSEAGTLRIIDELLSRQKKVFLPRVEGKTMVAVPYDSLQKLQKGAFGTLEPTGDAYDGEIEVAVVPLLAFNERGFRLGYGGGYYDKFLHGRTIKKVGLAYSMQRSSEFLEEQWDEPLDMLVCEKGIYYFGNQFECTGKT